MNEIAKRIYKCSRAALAATRSRRFVPGGEDRGAVGLPRAWDPAKRGEWGKLGQAAAQAAFHASVPAAQ